MCFSRVCCIGQHHLYVACSRAQRLDADLGEGEEQQATVVRAHMVLMAQLLALQRARLDAALQQHFAEAQVIILHGTVQALAPDRMCASPSTRAPGPSHSTLRMSRSSPKALCKHYHKPYHKGFHACKLLPVEQHATQHPREVPKLRACLLAAAVHLEPRMQLLFHWGAGGGEALLRGRRGDRCCGCGRPARRRRRDRRCAGARQGILGHACWSAQGKKVTACLCHHQ